MKGTLKQFSLSTLLRIFGRGEKTGKLSLSFVNDEAYEIWLQQGKIVSVTLFENKHRFHELLYSHANLDITNNLMFEKLSNICCEVNEPIGTCLKRQGFVTAIVLANIFRQQLQLGVYSLAKFPDGDFKFEVDAKLPYSEMTGLSKDASDASLELLRLLENEQEEKKLPSEESRFIKTGDGFLLNLSPLEWNVLEQISPRKTIKDLSLLVGLSTLEIRQICFRLKNVDLIKITHLPIETETPATSSSKLTTKPTKTEVIESKENKPNFSLLGRLTSVLKRFQS